MKHVDELAITKGTYVMKCRLFRWLLLHRYFRIARVVELQLNIEW